MATRDENKSTRARANTLREFLTQSQKENPFDQEEIYQVMDLCLSCKACKSECPSNVDITKYKAEFLQHYYDARGISLRTRLIANIGQINRLGSLFPALFNLIVKSPLLSGILKRILGFAPGRSIPLLYKTSLRTWLNRNNHTDIPYHARVFLLADEFTNYNDAGIGIKGVKLLRQLGYEVLIPKHKFSGRTYLSKGLVKKAAWLANKNVSLLSELISGETPLIGIEPSGILTFRDEYPELVDKVLVDKAVTLAQHCYTIDEFIADEFKSGRIQSTSFHETEKRIKLHGHCYQKALSSVQPTMQMLSIPANYEVEEIKSGCCGMAGAFGYEKEHYELSMQVGELVLFPAIRKENEKTIIAAPGTSCRHQIKDGTGRRALHPVEILYSALKQ
jgi:Fe-S oxidoreductase